MKAAAAMGMSLCLVASALAGQWDALSINVETASGEFATYQVTISQGLLASDGSRLDWNLASPVDLQNSNGDVIATIASASYVFQFSPRAAVDFDFAILSGDEPISVVAQSPVLPVPEFAAGTVGARTSVSLTLTDGGDGFAEVVSSEAVGVGAFRGRLNGLVLADLIYRMSVTAAVPNEPAGTVNANGSFPNFGFATIGIPVFQLSNDLSFHLTSGDVLVVDGSTELSDPIPSFACAADFDLNGVVDLGDLVVLLGAYGTCDNGEQFVPEADLTDDGCIDLEDLAEFLNLFGAGC